LSCTIANFKALVRLWESPKLRIAPNPVHDPTEFFSLEALVATANRDGYYGGLRLLFATAKKFHEHCHRHGIELPQRNFTAEYDTDIPRQVGLGGSSAIVTGMFRSLMDFYELTEDDIPLHVQPNIILSVETEELDITAGLQDRVVQAYGGLVYMDFDRELMETRGYGRYEPMDAGLLPPLFVAWCDKPRVSGTVHRGLRFRFNEGDAEVVNAVKRWAELAAEAREALLARDFAAFDRAMNENFDLRRRVLGDDVIGAHNLEMVAIARRHGRPAKFAGSGGAVIGSLAEPDQAERLEKEYRDAGYFFAPIEVAVSAATRRD